ncbi:MAG: DUF3299 domain-containing protein [Phycisphaerales bacterium JB040]
MKVFWSFMVVLFAASMGVLAMPERAEAPETASVPDAPALSRTTDRVATAGGTAAEETAAPVAAPVAESSDSIEPSESAEGALVATEATEEPQTQIQSQTEIASDDVSAPVDEGAAPGGDPFAAAARAYLGLDDPDRAEPALAEADDGARDEDADASGSGAVADVSDAPAGEAVATEASEDAVPARVAVNEDGSLLIDGRVTIPGAGTAERPYVLDWPVLTAVGREYKPEKGMDELPEWLTALEGKRVRLTGHIVLPLVAKATDELLLTMNPWDGCCVGVPPTPYDALEVSLSEAVSMSGASMYGAMEGTFRVEPYIVDGWLLGLYMLEEAEVKG